MDLENTREGGKVDWKRQYSPELFTNAQVIIGKVPTKISDFKICTFEKKVDTIEDYFLPSVKDRCLIRTTRSPTPIDMKSYLKPIKRTELF